MKKTLEQIYIYIYIYIYIDTHTHTVYFYINYIKIYIPNKKVFCGWDERKERKNNSIKTWKYNAINIPFHIIAP